MRRRGHWRFDIEHDAGNATALAEQRAIPAITREVLKAAASAQTAGTSTGNVPAGAVSPAPPVPATDPVADRAAALSEGANLLGKAGAARKNGNRNFAEQLFSSAEILLGPDAIAELAPLFREGAPPRVVTPLKLMPKDSPAQPELVGSSEAALAEAR